MRSLVRLKQLQDVPVLAIDQKLDEEFYSRLAAIQTDRRNQFKQQNRLAMFFSSAQTAVSPAGLMVRLSMFMCFSGLRRCSTLADRRATVCRPT